MSRTEEPAWRCVQCFWASGQASKAALESGQTSCIGLNPATELTRDQGLPLGPDTDERLSWQVYIDDYDEQEVTDFSMLTELESTQSHNAEILRASYRFWDSPGNDAKDDHRSTDLTRLGVRTMGVKGAMTGPAGYANELIDFSMDVIGEEFIARKTLQILLGRHVGMQQV